MSDDLKARFELASKEVTELSAAPDQLAKLKLYTLFKQSTVGDAKGDRPGMLDFVGRAKYDAWAELKGKSTDAAMEEYIAYVEELKAADAKK